MHPAPLRRFFRAAMESTELQLGSKHSRARLRRAGAFSTGRVFDDAHAFDGHKRTAGHHFVKYRQQPIDVCFVVDNLDQNGQVR